METMKTLKIANTTFKIVDSESLHYTEQSLSEEEQLQARKNIGAATVDEILSALPTWTGGSY